MRLIARLDVKNEHVIKGIHLEGLRKVGDPNELALRYYHEGVDEIIFMDAVASLYDRNNLFHIVKEAVRDVFVPIAIGGGIRSVDDVSCALDAGADKVVVNTGAVRDLSLVSRIANRFGSQCLIGSIEAKRGASGWEAYIDNGREPTGLDVITWANRLEDAGVGELLVTSVDQEGTKRGFDVDLVAYLQKATTRPVIVSGGYGKNAHLEKLLDQVQPSAVAFAGALHYGHASVAELHQQISQQLSAKSQKVLT